MIAYPCSANPLPNERWNTVPSGGVSQLVGAGSSKCLQCPPENRADGTGLIIYTCSGRPNDRWYPSGGTAKRIRLKVFALSDDKGTNPTTVTLNQFRAGRVRSIKSICGEEST